MIILAGTVIISLRNDGIIDKAKDAVDLTNAKQIEEIAQIAYITGKAEGKTGTNLENYIIENLNKSIGEEKMEKYAVVITESKVTIVPNGWQYSVIDIVDKVPIPKGFVASKAAGESSRDTGLVIYEGTEEVDDRNVYTARRTRNQYVWVPVENMSKFKRQNFGLNKIISETIGTEWWEITPTTTLNTRYMTQDDLDEVTEMYKSVEKYGGFYVARYEAGLDTARNASTALAKGKDIKSQMNKFVYNYLCYANSMSGNSGGAIEAARSIYPNDNTNTTGVISTLMYGVQRDTTVQWLLDTKAIASATDSTSYGNYANHLISNVSEEINEGSKYATYGDSGLKEYKDFTTAKSLSSDWFMTTGSLKVAKTNNIYDLAGNAGEWTMEGYSYNGRVRRGGSYDFTRTSHGVAYGESRDPKSNVSGEGFRAALYIK